MEDLSSSLPYVLPPLSGVEEHLKDKQMQSHWLFYRKRWVFKLLAYLLDFQNLARDNFFLWMFL